jgi:hypothetical protein
LALNFSKLVTHILVAVGRPHAMRVNHNNED